MASKKLPFLLWILLFANTAFSQVPVISSFTPASGPIGTAVTITGTNFSATASNNVVFFGATRASVTAATATQLTVTVPAGATYLPITVVVGGLMGYSSKPFSVTSGLLGIAASSFASETNFAAAQGPWIVSDGDLDGDGKSDIVTSSRSTPVVNVFRNTSTIGTLSYSKIDFTASNNTVSNTIGDIDGDGKPDLIVTNAGGSVSVFRNTSTVGNISFSTPVDFTTGSTFVKGVSIGDLDSDGKADIVVALGNAVSAVSILRNTSVIGTVSFAPKVDFTTGNNPESISIGDLDGDNKPEVVTANFSSGTASILRNTSAIGTISFAAVVHIATGTSPRSVALGDIDGDGKKDLAVANSVSNTVSIFRNISSIGTITLAARIDLTANSQPFHVSIGNLDGDGKPDLVVSTANGTSAVSVFRNTSASGSISFENKVDFGSGIGFTSSSIGDQDGDSKPDLVVVYFSASQINIFRNDMGTSQTIDFSALPTKTFGDAPFALSATATSSLPVNYTSSNTSVATVSGSTVTIVGAGTTSITARQPGNEAYAAAVNVQQNLTVNKLNQTITFGALATKTFGDAAFNLTASSSSTLPVSYVSSNTSVATISGSTVNIVGAGTTTITAIQNGNANYNPATDVPQTLTVNKANQTLTFGALTNKTFGDAQFALSATTSSGLAINFISSNTSVATVSGSTVTIVGAGTTTITASQAGNGNYNPATNVPQSLTVNKANQTITFGTLTNKTFGDVPFSLAATTSSPLPVGYTSSNTAVATISGNTVTIVGAGTTTLTASQVGNANYNAATSILQVLTVSKANQDITFGSLANKNVGDPAFALTATASSGLSISYTSSNTSVATISGNTVTVIALGTTIITASQSGNANYNPATSVQQTLSVKENQSITFGTLSDKTFGDADFLLTATATSNLSVSYSSSNPAVATVAGNTVTIIGAGTTTITASQAGNTGFNAAANVDQTLKVNKASQAITFATLSNKTFGDVAFTITATASSGLSIDYFSSNTAVATVSGSTITVIGAGTSIITAVQEGDLNFNAATNVDQTITVNKADQTITFAAIADKAVGDVSFPLSATASSGSAVILSTTSSKISLTGNQVTIVSAGRATVTAAQSGTNNYNAAASVDQSFCIKPAKPIITLSNTNTASPTLTSNALTGNQWYLNGTAISGATNTTLAITQAGVYKVQVQVDDCISTFSDDQPLIVTAVEPRAAQQLNVYPNPASEELIIALSGFELNKPVAIKVVDLLGREFHHTIGTGGEEVRIDIRAYQAGQYVLVLNQGHTRVAKQFIKSF